MSTDELTVLGAGVIGLSCAWRAAAAGRPVTVLDPAPGSGASWVAGGMLAPVTEAWPGEEALLELGVEAVSRWPGFAATLGADAGRQAGCAPRAPSSSPPAPVTAPSSTRWPRTSPGSAAPSTGCRAGSCAAWSPRSAPTCAAGCPCRVTSPSTTGRCSRRCGPRANRRACGSRPAPPPPCSTTGRGSSGVRCATGPDRPAATVLVVAPARTAAGLHPALDGLVRPVKGEILRLAHRAGALPPPRRTVRALVDGRPVYAVPRDGGGLVVGATQAETGFDTDVTVAGVRDLLRDAERVLPGIAEFALVETAAGLRPGSPDNLPLIGRIGPDGLLVATGHHRNGMLLAPVTADAVLALLRGGTVPAHVGVADPARFASVSRRG